MSEILNRHVKRKLSAALIAAMLVNQFPVTGYAEPLEMEAEAESLEQNQPVDVMTGNPESEEVSLEDSKDIVEKSEGEQDAVSYKDTDGNIKSCLCRNKDTHLQDKRKEG